MDSEADIAGDIAGDMEITIIIIITKLMKVGYLIMHLIIHLESSRLEITAIQVAGIKAQVPQVKQGCGNHPPEVLQVRLQVMGERLA